MDLVDVSVLLFYLREYFSVGLNKFRFIHEDQDHSSKSDKRLASVMRGTVQGSVYWTKRSFSNAKK